jgi:hypothetical protein
MKKVISVLVIMAVFSSAVFAAPLSVAGSLDTSSREVSYSAGSLGPEMFNDSNDLFADVEAVALTDTEAAEVEGEGWLGALVGGFVGSVIGLIDCGIHNGEFNKDNFLYWVSMGAMVGYMVIPD